MPNKCKQQSPPPAIAEPFAIDSAQSILPSLDQSIIEPVDPQSAPSSCLPARPRLRPFRSHPVAARLAPTRPAPALLIKAEKGRKI